MVVSIIFGLSRLDSLIGPLRVMNIRPSTDEPKQSGSAPPLDFLCHVAIRETGASQRSRARPSS